MLLPAQLETPRAVLIEVEVIAMVIAIGAWGGGCEFFVKVRGAQSQ